MREDDLPAPEIAESVLDLVGNTPLVKLGRLARAPAPPDPRGQAGDHQPGRLVEGPPGDRDDRRRRARRAAAARAAPSSSRRRATPASAWPSSPPSGATAAYFVMTDKVAPEKIDLLRAYGAEVVVCPVAVPPEDPASYYSTAERLVREIPGAFRPNQYANPANPLAHEQTTGPEIWRQTAGRITHFVAGAGTGGTITGVARYLKRQDPAVQIDRRRSRGLGLLRRVAAARTSSRASARTSGPTPTTRRSLDEVIAVQRRGGLPHGPPGGAGGGHPASAAPAALAVAAAIKVGRGAARPTTSSSCSSPTPAAATCRRSSTTSGWPRYGFLRECDLCVGAVLDARSERACPPLVYVNPEQTGAARPSRSCAATACRSCPVCKNEPPFAAAEVSGAVDELALMDAAFRDPSVLDTPVEKVMGPEAADDRRRASRSRSPSRCSTGRPALLVLAGGRPLSVLTRTDVLTFLSPSGRDRLTWPTRTSTRASASRPGPSTPARRPTRHGRGRHADHAVDHVRPGARWASTRASSTPARGNPTRAALEACLASLEGAAHGFAFASGLAAEDDVLRLLAPGRPDRARQRRLRRHLPPHRQGLRRRSATRGPPPTSPTSTRCATAGSPDTRMVWLETPTNPLLTCIDIEARGDAGPRAGRARRGRQHLRHALPAAAARARAPTSSCTRRPSTSAATPTSSAASSPSTTTSWPSASASPRTPPAPCPPPSTATSCCAA